MVYMKKMPISQMKLHVGHMEVAVANLIGWRENVIVPNVYFGLGLRHEADLIVLDKSGRLTEIEIKCTLSDLKADFKKPHSHQSSIISRLVYAVPDKIVDYAKENIPPGAGLISVKWSDARCEYMARWERMCRHKKTDPPGHKITTKLMALGCMRIWTLKKKLNHISHSK